MGDTGNTNKILVGKPERKRLLGRCRHICHYFIKINHRIIGYVYVDWNQVVQGSVHLSLLVNMVMNLGAP
jgi:hypothetical protein